MGHVDAGKTKFLDCIRGTCIQEKEAGGITQHIGATEVPLETIHELSKGLLQKYKFNLSIPGILFIDTPGHEAFTNLRKRGGSIADLAVLMVDVHKGLQNQTIEAIEILKSYKTPFIVALNKIDSIKGWNTGRRTITEGLSLQSENVLEELDKKIYELAGQLSVHGFNAERFDRVQNFTQEILVIPTSAKYGEGIPEVLLFLAGLTQKFLEKNISINETGPGKGTVLEVKEEKGLGLTMDVILYNGKLKVGDEIAVGGKDGVIRTKIRALLEPNPLDEIRSPQDKFKNIKEVYAATGVKVVSPGIAGALSGSPLRVIITGEEVKEVQEEIQNVKIDSDVTGAIIKTDALGSLEALIKLLEGQEIKIRKADIGFVSRRDVMEAESIKEKDKFKGVIFAFNTKIPHEISEEAEKKQVKIFSGNVIYKLIEEYEEWINSEKEKSKQELLRTLVLPAKFKIMKDHIFRNCKPAIVGVKVLGGKLRKGIKVMKNEIIIGEVKAMQADGKSVEEANENQELAVSIDKAVVGKNLFEEDTLYSFIPLSDLTQLNKIKDSLTDTELDLIDEIKKIEEKMFKEESA
ncbi:MAG: translation initiation factor IF-2 [Candidatus Diapherotrites archaeon]|nr:translation initiation factor IF-2 [Candidatus Diapherotrites archaeon]